MKKFYIYLLSLSIVALSSISAFSQDKKNLKADGDPLFEVKNDAGQTVFAVYPGGVKVFVDDKAKSSGAGFTVGRLSTGKATNEPIFSVKPNDVQVILDDKAKSSATGAGFTVGRLSTGKATDKPILSVNPNDVQVLLDDQAKSGATGAGFTVGRLSTGKATDIKYFHVTPDSTRVYANKNTTNKAPFAFASISDSVESNAQISLTEENYLIGHKVAVDVEPPSTNGPMFFDNLIIGKEASKDIKTGSNNIIIGKESANMANSLSENIFIGNGTGKHFDKYAGANVLIGHEAGINRTGGYGNVFIGYQAGKGNTSGNPTSYNVCIGYQARNRHDRDSTLTIGVGNKILLEGYFGQQELHVNGTLYTADGSVSTSDQRLKTNILPLQSGISIIKSLIAYYYDWNEDAKSKFGCSDDKQIGLMAQDVEKVLPEAVSNNPATGYKGINYSKLIPVLLTAIKEQNKTIEKLQADVKELKNKL